MNVQPKSIIVLTLLGVCSFGYADELGPSPHGSKQAQAWRDKGWAMAAEVESLLDSNEADDVSAATQKAKWLLDARIEFLTGSNGAGAIKKFLTKGKFETLLDLADYGILSHPEDTKGIIMLQRLKVVALTQLHRDDEAKAAAKAYYNISSLVSTDEAMQFFVKTLLVTSGSGGAALADRFKQEQISGANAVATDKLKQPKPRTGVLDSIPIDPHPFVAAIDQRSDYSFQAMTGKGNLLLLADRTSEAQDVFNAAYSIADPKDLAVAEENVARAIRAVDGAVGRANSWIESVQGVGSTESVEGTPPKTDAKSN